MAKEFEIRVYGKQELAQLYLPHCSGANARRKLQAWIDGDAEFKATLQAAGYRPGQHLLTPKQVKIIVEYLDPPPMSSSLY